MSAEHTRLRSGTRLPASPHRPAPYHGPNREEILALRREYLNPSLFTYYREPLCIIEGHMQYVWDDAGRQYLDALGGIAVVCAGHCHPKITARTCEQLARLVHTTTIYLHPTIERFAQALAGRMPAGSNLKVSYFTNSGSEANDLATMMAQLATGHIHILALRNGYHGGTQATMAITALETWKYPIPSPVQVSHAPPGYCYRCPLGLTYPACQVRCARSLEDIIRYETSGRVACFIAESIQGIGGVIVPPPEYFTIAYEIVRRYGGLCIADEVQAGMGRTGAHFWGFENWNVVPDMVTIAKGLGNGAPVAACITRPEIADRMTQRMHFNTFGGNPVSVTQGLATLEVLAEEKMQENAALIGAYLKERLNALQDKHALIGEVRGMGLLLGVELVADRESKTPAAEQASTVLELARQRGLLLGKAGLYGNVIRLTPPLCITRDDAAFLVDCLDECLDLAAGAA